MNSGVILIRLKAYDNRLLDASAQNISNRVAKTGAKVRGPIPLPVKSRRYTVIRSPHVFKNSREHFKVTVYKRLLLLSNAGTQTVESLMRMELPAGVDVKVKVNED